MDRAQIGDVLAMVNASLNATSAVALATGYVFIRRREAHLHRWAMTTALTASALFLIFYLTRVAFTGTHEFAGEGPARVAYLAILFSHMVLAVAVVPLVLRLLWLLGKRRFRDHARLARWTFPIWAYVSVTGLVVYLLLYQVYGYR
jgi:putative membrane protein